MSLEGGGHNLGTYGGAESEKAALLAEIRALAAASPADARPAPASLADAWRPGKDEWLAGVEAGYVFRGNH